MVRVADEKSFVLADIPGLIEGASEGIGLGHDFLKHIERTSVLAHVVDVSGSEHRDPIEDFYKINQELEDYNEKLAKKAQIVVANKMDIPSSMEELEKLKAELQPKGYTIYPVSAATGEGINELKYGIWDLLLNTEIVDETYDEEYVEYKKEEETIIVRKEEDMYIVEGTFIERLVESVYFDDVDSLRFFQDTLRKRGIIEELEKLGVQEGDSIFILDNEFEFFH